MTFEYDLARLKSIKKSEYLESSFDRMQFINRFNLDNIKNQHDPKLLNKYLILKVLAIAEASSHKSFFNMTHNFRRLVGLQISSTVHNRYVLYPPQLDDVSLDEEGPGLKSLEASPPQYERVNLSDGVRIWYRRDLEEDSVYGERYYKLNPNDDLDELNITEYTYVRNFTDIPDLPYTPVRTLAVNITEYTMAYEITKYDCTFSDLNHPESLRQVLQCVEKASTYDHSLGYDLLQGTYWISDLIACYTVGLSYLLMVPVLPVSFLLIVGEVLIIDPIKNLITKFSDDPIETYISLVSNPDSNLKEEVEPTAFDPQMSVS